MTLFLFFLSLISPISRAQNAPTGIKTLSESSLGTWKGDTITTDTKGVKFRVEKTHTQIELAPHSVLKIQSHESTESMELISGMARARVEKSLSAKDHPVKFYLHSQVATMGIRGTDFLAVSNPVLSESEIIVFEGNVDFASNTDKKDVKQVTTGHWGGVGGRFGAKTHDLMALPKTALDYFDQLSTVN